ncbi:MAG: hypothetical protein KME15_20240 [Drouetiella hepatica Uher 2000/2452]|jgi:hypothetical protein|uniref:Uncharacterized protein n=1 Tax=Drouetiella hepatica Uher 2000/2452 TaxID=904376 RepID=A0A951UR06_9CYAN|nr:hypothetical protein [Drouetiella hepatica Uher 2000/2452]
MQLDLLTYQPSPEEMTIAANPSSPVAPPANQHAIAWQEAKAAYYLRLMSRFVGTGRLSTEVNQREISRLFAMRLAALEELRRLRGE